MCVCVQKVVITKMFAEYMRMVERKKARENVYSLANKSERENRVIVGCKS